ncbi:fimbrial usher BcfC, partial [Leptospira borgpetersenii serovar Hardjo-bovis]|nr:fimbrial usher BcfC [Leptospira borgpetersenii serovar Hardjo-bovis]
TLIWGLPHGFTLYGGTQLSSHYHALAIGSGANLGNWGAVSLDVTQATSTLADNNTYQGQSLRFLYAKSLAQSGTNLQLMGYRYSTSGSSTLDDTTWKRMSGYDADSRTESDKSRPEWADYYNLYYTRRGKVQLDINQQLGGLGSLFITGSQQSYWHTDEKDSLLQVGYSDTLAGIAWSVSYNNNKAAGDAERDQIFALNISVPLSQWLQHGDEVTRHHNVYATFSTSTDKQHNVTQNA